MSGKRTLEVSCLIAEVHRRPELWDRQHPQHHNRSVLDHHWDSVAAMFDITGKAARGKWKNLKDHFRKEYKRCMTLNRNQEISKWPYFHSMMFIKDQISHNVSTSSYLSNMQYQNIYPEVEMREGSADEDTALNCLNVEFENQNVVDVNSEYSSHDENISDDQHFLLSLLPMFAALPPEKKLKARIAIETSLLNIAYPDLSTTDNNNSQVDQNGSSQKSPTKAEKRKRTTTANAKKVVDISM